MQSTANAIAKTELDFSGEGAFRRARIAHWERVADFRPSGAFRRAYHERLTAVYSALIPPGSKVLELGCGSGALLAAVRPSRGVGIDFSPKMLEQARRRHPELALHCADVHQMDEILGDERFDFIILSDILNDLWDVQAVLQAVARHCHPGSRIVINLYSRLWQGILGAAQALKLANPVMLQNWLTREDVTGLLRLAGLEMVKIWQEVLLPAPVPLVAGVSNRILSRLWPFSAFTLSNFILARPAPEKSARPHTVSVVVPARNEAGNIEAIFQRTPEMGAGTELIFVEGNSSDDTFATVEAMLKKYPGRDACLLKQDGKGKGDAVRKGFSSAHGEILMILDADMTVSPEDLPRFYEAITANKGEFINGVRLVYPMEKEAMRFLNLLGNKTFSMVFSWMLGQTVKDTLCGTKVLWKRDYALIEANRAYFGDFDPFGDFDLLFGAARLGLKIVDLPIRYRERTYGTTNIRRWSHGWQLFRMVLFAAGRIKFV